MIIYLINHILYYLIVTAVLNYIKYNILFYIVQCIVCTSA